MDELVAQLRLLKAWAGGPSYAQIAVSVNELWSAAGRPEHEWTAKATVADCFKVGRVRPNVELLLGIVEVLNPDQLYVAQWRQALRIVRGEAEAATFVQAQLKLPEGIAGFTGRRSELDCLTDRLGDSGRAGPVVISAIEGMAGVGKTQLAVHAGHRLLRGGRFECVLFVNLRGFHDDPSQPAVDPAAALDSFLRLLGVAGHAIPGDLAGRMQLFREHLARRRILVVLDNAADEAQVRPLLPDTASSRVLITSRRALSGLRDAEHLRLDVFTPDEADGYLRATLGADRVDAEPGSAEEIARILGYLPLALALTAARIAAQTDANWTLSDQLDRLRRRRDHLRLDSAVSASISLSDEALPASHRRTLRLLTLHPGVDFEVHAAAALTGADLETVRGQLRHMLANNMVHRKSDGRYELHDLIRAYATAQVHDEERYQDRRAAFARLVEFYLYTASLAMDIAYPYEPYRRPRVPLTAHATISFLDEAAARSWLDTERANLLAVATDPIEESDAVLFSGILWRHLLTVAHYPDALALHERALSMARGRDDVAGQAEASINLGIVDARMGQYERAIDHLNQSRALFRNIANSDGDARALLNLGHVLAQLGRYEQASDHHRQSLALFIAVGDVAGQAHALIGLGSVDRRVGRYDRAAGNLNRALVLFRAVGDRDGQADALNNLGVVYGQVGDDEQAAGHYRQALALCREIGHRDGEASALNNLGAATVRLGRYQRAVEYHRQALALCRELHNPEGEASALNNLGAAYAGMGQYQRSVEYHRQALALSGDLRHPEGEARAHAGLGHAWHGLGRPDQAREHWRQALSLYTVLGAPQASEIRAHLAGPDKGESRP